MWQCLHITYMCIISEERKCGWIPDSFFSSSEFLEPAFFFFITSVYPSGPIVQAALMLRRKQGTFGVASCYLGFLDPLLKCMFESRVLLFQSSFMVACTVVWADDGSSTSVLSVHVWDLDWVLGLRLCLAQPHLLQACGELASRRPLCLLCSLPIYLEDFLPFT